MRKALLTIALLALYAQDAVGLDICENQANGKFLAHPGDCSKFIVCAEQKTALISSCPEGLHFSRQKGICDFKNIAGCELTLLLPSAAKTYAAKDNPSCSCCNCDCCNCGPPPGCPNGITVCEGKTDNTTLPYGSDSSQYYLCNAGCATIETCSNGFDYNADTGQCQAQDTGCECSNGITVCEGKTDGTTLPYGSDSSQYYLCNGGCANIETCCTGSVYNSATGQCEPQGNPGCPNGITVCDGKPDGATLPITGDSSQYYVCNGGCATIKFCPDNSEYNSTTGQCESQGNSGCTNGITVCEGKPDGTTLPITGNSSQYYVCNGGCATIKFCPDNSEYNSTTGQCESQGNSGCTNGITVCEGKPDGATLPITGDSSQYYVCNGGCATIKFCPDNSEYNSTTGQCESQGNSGCTNGITVCDGKPDGATLPITGNSSQYYVCNGGCATIEFCPDNSEYNSTTGQCESQGNSGCTNGITVCDGKPDGATLPITGDSSQYYVCNDGCATIEFCPDNSEYNSTTGQCESQGNSGCTNGITVCDGKPDGTTLPITGDSSQYYVCNGGCATIKFCPDNSEYNSTTGQCESQGNSGCTNGITVCEGKPDGTTLPITGDSSQYYVCNGGCATIKFCPDNSEYNPTTGKCEPNDVPGPSTGPSGTSCVSGGKCVGQPDGTLFSDPPSNGYIICQCECEIARPCPNGLVFNPVVNVCDWPNGNASGSDNPGNFTVECTNDSDICKNQKEGALFPVEGVCNKFFKCNFGCAVEIECPNNLIYKSSGQYCDYPQNVECPWPYSPPSGPSAGPSGIACPSGGRCVGQREGTFLASTTGCGKYVVCQCECEVEMDCPIGLYFDTVNNVCDYPEKVQCS